MISVIKIRETSDLEAAFDIRRKVFVEEQAVPLEEEIDVYEAASQHYLAFYDDFPCGTARRRFTEKGIKLERFAVLVEFRKHGIGSALVDFVLRDLRSDDFYNRDSPVVYLHAQLAAIPLYEKFGFKKQGKEFEECGIRHYKMVLARE